MEKEVNSTKKEYLQVYFEIMHASDLDVLTQSGWADATDVGGATFDDDPFGAG